MDKEKKTAALIIAMSVPVALAILIGLTLVGAIDWVQPAPPISDCPTPLHTHQHAHNDSGNFADHNHEHCHDKHPHVKQ